MKLGRVLADYRYAQRIGVRALAKEIGTSSATLSRIENEGKCDGAVLIKIMLWLFKDTSGASNTHTPRHRYSEG